MKFQSWKLREEELLLYLSGRLEGGLREREGGGGRSFL